MIIVSGLAKKLNNYVDLKMIKKAFILQKGTGHFHHEEGMIVQELEKRGIPYRSYSQKHILRRQLPLDRESLVVGGKDEIYGALKQLDIPIPKPDSYPLPLRPFLHRKVWESTLGKEERNITVLDQPPTFLKPLGREKCFTGRVFSTYADFRTLNISAKEPVYCSEVIEWLSEYRVYICDGSIRSIDHYDGDESIKVDVTEVEKAIEVLRVSDFYISGLSLDFGVLKSGETALVEMNDAFALGAYEIGAKDYTDLIITRWEELLSYEGNS